MGEVLRRYRAPRDTAREVAAMEHARAHGYPAPRARAVSDMDIVMERITGPTMLAQLHKRLGDGDALLHLDLPSWGESGT